MGEAEDCKTAPTPSSPYYLLAHTFHYITTALSASIYLQHATDSQSIRTKPEDSIKIVDKTISTLTYLFFLDPLKKNGLITTANTDTAFERQSLVPTPIHRQ